MWNQQTTLTLIEDLHRTPCLWDGQCADYRNRTKKNDELERLAEKFKINSLEMEKKIQALKNQFRREHRKVMELENRGASIKKVLWFGYEYLLFLLQGHEYKERRSMDQIQDKTEISPSDNPTKFLDTYIIEDSFDGNSDIESSSTNNYSPTNEHLSKDSTIRESLKRKEYTTLHTQPDKKKIKDSVSETSKCMKTVPDSVTKRDEYSMYGEYIASRLKNCGRPRLEIATAQHEIDSICYKLTMGEYSKMLQSSNFAQTTKIHVPPTHLSDVSTSKFLCATNLQISTQQETQGCKIENSNH